jgi:hypothetical protein
VQESSGFGQHVLMPTRISSRHNNNDLGLVVNNDDIELSRDFEEGFSGQRRMRDDLLNSDLVVGGHGSRQH